MDTMTRSLFVSLAMVLATTGVALAQSRTAADSSRAALDGVAIDPDAELIVALADDTTNMDPRIGMGSIRSNYIRQVYESLVDVDTQGRPVPGLALSWKPVGELTWECAASLSTTASPSTPTRYSSTSTASSAGTSTSGG